MALSALLLPVAAVAADALADGTALHPDDVRRLAGYHAAAGDALLQAFAGGGPVDLATLADVLAGTAMPPDAALAVLPGEWSCRTIKMGRLIPIVAYQPFQCRIGADGALEKVTGSQRTRGRVHRDEKRLVYLGTGYVAGDDPPAYADLPPYGTGAMPQRVPEVGVVEMITPDRGRIMLPDPYLESRFNILTLER